MAEAKPVATQLDVKEEKALAKELLYPSGEASWIFHGPNMQSEQLRAASSGRVMFVSFRQPARTMSQYEPEVLTNV